MPSDSANWSGEGELTQAVLARLAQVEAIAFLRVEDAPASRADTTFAFISNEIYVAFVRHERRHAVRRFGILPATRRVVEKAMSIADLERLLGASAGIGAPDYADETMLQYLRAERVVPPYQTRGYKVVELLRIYEISAS